MNSSIFNPHLTPWERFRRDPAEYIVKWLYQHRHPARTPVFPPTFSDSLPITVACVSDTHCTQPEVPDGDHLLHAGDLTVHGQFEELQSQLDWINSLPHRHKVVIAGNHDLLLDTGYVSRHPYRVHDDDGRCRADLRWGDIIYLDSSATTLKFAGDRALKVYGSPWTPQYGDFAFQHPRLHDIWTDTVPDDADILLTHGPPKGHLDGDGMGSEFLLKEIRRVRPRLVVFGHIHGGHGRQEIVYDRVEATYDEVMTKEKGLWTAIFIGCFVFLEWFWTALLPPPWQSSPPDTTLVNAASMVGLKRESRPAIVVEL